jgi:hypothetical protein
VKTDPVVVIGGSRSLPPGLAPRILVRFLANLPHGAVVRLRRGINTAPGLFEIQVEAVCDVLGTRVEWWRPHPGGREKVFSRDMEMVEGADLVLCFWLERQTGDEESGTVALANKAIDLRVPVYAYALADDGTVGRAGEHDSGDVWAGLVPDPAW